MIEAQAGRRKTGSANLNPRRGGAVIVRIVNHHAGGRIGIEGHIRTSAMSCALRNNAILVRRLRYKCAHTSAAAAPTRFACVIARRIDRQRGAPDAHHTRRKRRITARSAMIAGRCQKRNIRMSDGRVEILIERSFVGKLVGPEAHRNRYHARLMPGEIDRELHQIREERAVGLDQQNAGPRRQRVSPFDVQRRF